MTTLLRLALASLLSRWGAVTLAALSIAISVALLLGVDTARKSARASFDGAISGTDLVVGARGGGVQLMLYAVFRLGSASNNLTWESYQDIAAHPAVDWIVPLSLGDSHRGFRVLGTDLGYFEHYKVRRDESLRFAEGGPFGDLYDAVIGADVAEALGYTLGQRIVVAHGIGQSGLQMHDDKPFQIAGVLRKTGTPVDRTVHVSLEAIEAIHIDWSQGAPIPGLAISAEETRQLNLQPQAVTAALIGVRSKLQIFDLQRFVNAYPEEPLTAVLPGVALFQLWSVVGVGETALQAVAALVAAAALLGMATMLLATLGERRREMAILRAVGAGPRVIFGLLVAEAGLIALLGALLGALLHAGAVLALAPWVDAAYGVVLAGPSLGGQTLLLLGAVTAAGAALGLAPAWRAYRLSLLDGIAVRA